MTPALIPIPSKWAELKTIHIHLRDDVFQFQFEGNWLEHEALGALELAKKAATEKLK